MNIVKIDGRYYQEITPENVPTSKPNKTDKSKQKRAKPNKRNLKQDIFIGFVLAGLGIIYWAYTIVISSQTTQ